jgi:hypothetical protein
MSGLRSVMTAAAVAALFAVAVPSAYGSPATAIRVCKPVINPYPGTRYEGVNLSRIRATAVSCRNARRVARGAHRKALGLPLPPDGIRRFRWRKWRVTGDLRPSRDIYVAKHNAKRVRWRF